LGDTAASNASFGQLLMLASCRQSFAFWVTLPYSESSLAVARTQRCESRFEGRWAKWKWEVEHGAQYRVVLEDIPRSWAHLLAFRIVALVPLIAMAAKPYHAQSDHHAVYDGAPQIIQEQVMCSLL
jgi:hypothetical protein